MKPWTILLSCTLVNSVVRGNDIRDGIREASTAHESAVQAARDELDLACRKAIKTAANTERLTEVRAILDAREMFLATGQIPTLTELEMATKEYVTKRKESARLVYQAYRTAIETAAKELLLEEARAIKEEMVRFVDAERVAVGLATEKARPVAKTVSPSEPASVPTIDTRSFLEDFIARFKSELERISELTTSAQKNEEHRKIVKKFDDEIQRRTLVFDFPIKNVVESGEGYQLVLGTPPQLENIDFLNRADGVLERIKKSEALSLSKESVYTMFGLGRLAIAFTPSTGYQLGESSGRVYRILTFRALNNETGYAIYLQGYKSKIQK